MKKIWVIIFLMLFLSGCGSSPAEAHSRMVIGITVSRDGVTRRYAGEDSMRRILTYLRRLEPYGKAAENPEALPGEDFRIRLEYSDGSEKIYHQKGRQYLQIDSKPWQQIDPQDARELSLLFAVLPE